VERTNLSFLPFFDADVCRKEGPVILLVRSVAGADPFVRDIFGTEDGVTPDCDVSGNDREKSDPSMLSGRETDWLRSSGTGVLRALARATVRDAALAKRASGSFARLRSMTCARADEMVGFMSAGGVGGVLRC
jgi:hypothetical protein